MRFSLPRPGRLLASLILMAGVTRAADSGQRLVNLSSRVQVGTGLAAPVIGFVVGEGPPKQVLIRALGPGLNRASGLAGTLANPLLVLFDGKDLEIARNDNWNVTSVGGAQTFASVGAFTIATGSTDAALLAASLGPGTYTAQVTGLGSSPTGLILLEVYDVSGQARLMNLSTRAKVGTGAGIVISGLVVPADAGTRKILVRAAGPTLGLSFGLVDSLVDPSISILDSADVQVAANDNWGSEHAAAISAASTQTGAFPLLAGSKDAALIADLAPGRTYSILLSGVGGTTGLALLETYDLTPASPATARVDATIASTDAKGAAPALFTVSRTGSTAGPLTVYYNVAGTAIAGLDYESVPGAVTIPAGATSATVAIAARHDAVSPAINKDVNLTLVTGPGYTPGAGRAASVAIYYNPGTLYLTSLRTAPGTVSTGFGTATIQLSNDHTFAIVNLAFSNLSSPETVAYLRYGQEGEVGVELARLPNGQVNGMVWTPAASGALSAADIIQGIRDGRVFVSIESANYPGGELRGAFIQANGSLSFTPPAEPPALVDNGLSAVDAARFLTQATFGPTKPEIDALTSRRLSDLDGWIASQIALGPSLLLDATRADFNNYTALTSDNPQYSYQNRQAGWWKNVLTAPDQLRQRVAFALSQVFVVSDVDSTLNRNPLGLANYYDLLVTGAFGNFRELLEKVTLSPVMGLYLSSLRNRKGTFDARGQVVTSPDENYAREVMQLFTIGLNRLQPDGTLQLDPLGLPIPTYDQKTITEMAKVFTGWAFYSPNNNPDFTRTAANWIEPMMLYPAFHEDGAKTIVGGVLLPANQGGARDLRDALDALFQHPNTGPFIARQLIQRLVTSNPSPGYTYRAARVFADNGAGVRGDLGAVVRAILLDYEARSPVVAATASFGKLREPLLRATALLRAFNGTANNGRYAFFVAQTNESQLGQTALHAPTVFNFFEPNYIQPGPLAAAGLYAPEYQILTDTTSIAQPNQLWSYIYANRSQGATPNRNEATVGFVFEPGLLALARTPAALIDYTNLLLAGGGLAPATRTRMVSAISALPNNTAATDLERVRSAIYLTVTVPQGAVQK